MMWANTPNGKTLAQPGVSGTCPMCGKEVVPKCGEIVSWHWAHKARDCDSWGEPESEWHMGWKDRFPPSWQEVTMGPHRADVLTPRGVVEFQRSAISGAEIREREQFYGKMIWVVDATDFNLERYDHWNHRRFLELNGEPKFDLFGGPYLARPGETEEERNARIAEWEKSQEDWVQFRERLRQYLDAEHLKSPCYRWLWPRKTWLQAQKTIVLDRGNGELLRVKKVYGKSSVYLACAPLTVDALLRHCGVTGVAA
jgi:hypothetical protein